MLDRLTMLEGGFGVQERGLMRWDMRDKREETRPWTRLFIELGRKQNSRSLYYFSFPI